MTFGVTDGARGRVRCRAGHLATALTALTGPLLTAAESKRDSLEPCAPKLQRKYVYKGLRGSVADIHVRARPECALAL